MSERARQRDGHTDRQTNRRSERGVREEWGREGKIPCISNVLYAGTSFVVECHVLCNGHCSFVVDIHCQGHRLSDIRVHITMNHEPHWSHHQVKTIIHGYAQKYGIDNSCERQSENDQTGSSWKSKEKWRESHKYKDRRTERDELSEISRTITIT